ncbi:hypothetical protein [Clostridium sp.]|uniref:hypothetical protein n=1 Tax=Clostridium sp. TaxID=1506 RepID=UPI002FC7AE73
MFTYIYLISILLMFMLIYEGITTSFTYAPKKIKAITIIAMILILLRFIALLLLFVYDKMQYVYLLKPLIFLELFYMPIIIFICIYIYSRNEKIKLSFFYILCGIFIMVYFMLIIKAPLVTNLSNVYGYSITLENGLISYLVLLSINSFVFILGFKIYGFRHSNKIGVIMIVISALVTIITTVVSVLHPDFVGVIIGGELFWMITLDYGLRKFIR